MCNLVVKQIWFVLLVWFAVVNTEVNSYNGGYNVLVSFSQNVKSTEGWELLEKMKESLQKASSILHGAVGRQFTKVTFEIPEYWNTSQTEINIDSSSVPKYAKPDFLIDGTNNVIFGKFPYAQQYGGCGIPGHQITIPTAFFSDDNKFPRGTALAREWLKYRYGVFDENGYKQDPLYPLYRHLPLNENSELRVTDCTNNPVAYDLQGEGEAFSEDNQPSPQSKVIPDNNTLENVTSSIMYFHQDIPNLLHICGKDSDHPHNALSPNKHNAMCRSQSIWEVVRNSDDFKTETDSKEYRDIEFIYARERRLKIVIAWENTINVGENKGKMICNTIKRFAYELPQGTKFNAFPFSDTLSSEKDYTLKELNDLKDKNAIMADIMSDFVKTSNGNLTIAVDKALEILRSDSSNSEPEGTIIVISKSGEGISSTLLEIISKYNVCVKILSLSEGNSSHHAEYYNSATPCGFPEDISTDNNEAMFNQLFASMEAVLPATVDDKITETVKTGYLSQEASVSLEVDETVEKVTFWMLTKRELENFKMKFNQNERNLIAMKTTTDIMALSFNPQEAGSIEIAYPHQTEPIFTQVRVTFKDGKYLNGFLYIHDTTTEKSTHQMPVILYAIMRYGAYPVQNAKVTATIERPDDENFITLEMLDDGTGDPDITENDGVYSRYFTQFNKEGPYTVNVKVEITDLTLYGVNENADYLTCCGSFLETASSKIKGSIKYFKTGFNAKSGRPDTGYKPSRITDLRIAEISDGKIVLKWSAPGEEGDSGTVSRYEIKLFCKKENSTDCSASIVIQVLNKSLPFSYGTEQEATIQILIKTHSIFVGIITYNDKNKTSDLSNIIQIFESPETIVKITKYPEASIHSGTIIGIVIVCVLVVICLAIAIIFYIKRKPPYTEQKDKELEEDMNSNDQIKITFKETNFSIKTVPLKRVESFPIMLYTHDQIKDRRDKSKDPPLYKAHVSPKPWASLDHLSSMKTGQYDRDAISLGSSSTIPATEESHNVRK